MLPRNAKKRNIGILIALNIALLPLLVFAMNSTNYKINADTINSGGNLSNSADYHLGDSAGEAATGEERSANFKSKTAFWHMIPGGSQLGLHCEASTVYMMDYTLGNAGDVSTYTYSTSEKCDITANSSASWDLTMQSSNMTSAKNNLSNSNIFLDTNNDPATAGTITAPTTGISESAGPEYPLNTPATVISGSVLAVGNYTNRPTVSLKHLNSLFDENISGTITITIQ